MPQKPPASPSPTSRKRWQSCKQGSRGHCGLLLHLSDIEEALAELQEALGSSTVAAIIEKVEAHALALEALEEKAIECAASLDALVEADECDDEENEVAP